MAARWTMLAAEVDDLQVQVVPALFGKEALAVFFGLLDIFAIGQTPAIDQPVDMRVDWKSGYAEVLRHHYLSGLVANAGQSFECFHVRGDLAAVLVE